MQCNTTISWTASDIEEGAYTLSSIEGDDTFDKTELVNREIKYQTEPLGIQINLTPAIDKNSKDFTIILAFTTATNPKIYIDNDETKEISCEKNENNSIELI